MNDNDTARQRRHDNGTSATTRQRHDNENNTTTARQRQQYDNDNDLTTIISTAHNMQRQKKHVPTKYLKKTESGL